MRVVDTGTACSMSLVANTLVVDDWRSAELGKTNTSGGNAGMRYRLAGIVAKNTEIVEEHSPYASETADSGCAPSNPD